MLSYRHSFHAGNFADVLKHIVLIELFGHYLKKDKPFDYIDTHAGAGIFNLLSKDAKKLSEHSNGISKLIKEKWPELKPYLDTINSFNKPNTLIHYPGSPSIATHFLRKNDRAWLFELHPADFELLEKNMGGNKKTRFMKADGLKGLAALLPPTSRRGIILIDPSYEIKTEFDQVEKTIENAHKKFSTGTYAIWYPVVNRDVINKFVNKFVRSGIKDIQRFELGIKADSEEKGMTSSGMIVINPPWGLFEKMSLLLPKLVKALGESDEAFFKCDILVEEP